MRSSGISYRSIMLRRVRKEAGVGAEPRVLLFKLMNDIHDIIIDREIGAGIVSR